MGGGSGFQRRHPGWTDKAITAFLCPFLVLDSMCFFEHPTPNGRFQSSEDASTGPFSYLLVHQ
jgi:hypothetical protein